MYAQKLDLPKIILRKYMNIFFTKTCTYSTMLPSTRVMGTFRRDNASLAGLKEQDGLLLWHSLLPLHQKRARIFGEFPILQKRKPCYHILLLLNTFLFPYMYVHNTPDIMSLQPATRAREAVWRRGAEAATLPRLLHQKLFIITRIALQHVNVAPGSTLNEPVYDCHLNETTILIKRSKIIWNSTL